jgi:eukaryotic-like serine/threonine-protein kinase
MTSSNQIHLGVQPGDVLAGKYQVERVLGAGGMGIVVAAHHIQLDTKVAIKFLLPAMLSNQEAIGRFSREARAAVRITSEHVARVIDVGTLETGAPYMVMEYLEGGDLASWLRQRGPLPIEQAVEFVLQACVAVAEAHGLGIVHRDLKPANLFCIRRPDGQLSVKVLDFGISKVTDLGRAAEPAAMSMTKTSAIMGSPLYMSPEQMHSTKSADAQSDIWALGIILYELLAGRVPFEGEAVTEVAVKVSVEPPPPLRSFRPDSPPGLEAVILKCLEKDRRNRYRNVAQLALALAEFAPKRARASIERITNTIQASGLSTSDLESPPSPHAQGAVVSPGTIAPVGQTTPGLGGSPRRGLVVAVLGVAVATLLAVGATGVVLVRRGAARTPGPVTGSSAPVTLAPTTPPPPEATVAPLPASDPSVSASSAPAAPSNPAAVSTSPIATPAPAPRPAAAAASRAPSAAAPRATAKTNCVPPFFFDLAGHKQYKPECM